MEKIPGSEPQYCFRVETPPRAWRRSSDSTFCAPLSINNKETNKETIKGDTSEKKFTASQQSDFSLSRDFLSQKKKAAKHSDLPEVSEMDEEKQKMISDLMTRFAQ